MDYIEVIRSQYLAALEMIKQAIEKCPEELWNPAEDRAPFWHVAYHALFYTHLYLQPRLQDFRPWAKHREEAHRLEQHLTAVYSPAEVLEYLGLCQQEVKEKTAQLDLEAASGFDWLRFNKLELQFYNIRHLQQHTGELMERLGARAKVDVDWVGDWRD